MNYRDLYTPTLKIYRLARLSLLSACAGGEVYRKLSIVQSRAFPQYDKDGTTILPPRFFDPNKPGFVAVLDIDPIANLAHDHLYRVWQFHEAPTGQYRVQAELFFHGYPIEEQEGVEEIEKEVSP